MSKNVDKAKVKLWVDALRSGKYQQSKMILRDNSGYCCLGVACDIAKEDVGGDWESDNSFLGKLYNLPDPVKDWFGFNTGTPKVNVGDMDSHLTALNDSGQYDFNGIADLIEKEYL